MAYLQAERPLLIRTPLGEDTLLITRLRAREAISQLFSFDLALLAERKTKIDFGAILGQGVTVRMRIADGSLRYFHGIVKAFAEGERDENFVRYRAEAVPKLWLLTKKVRSRTFQHLTVPDILQQLFAGLDVVYEISGTYYHRDYCVQYRESDFAFASRLMEEEGVYYFFKHADGSHQMVVTDMPSKHPHVPGSDTAIYEEIIGWNHTDMRVTAWEKMQEMRSGEYTLWDHCFELPGNNLEAKEKTIDSVTVGKVAHQIKVGGNDDLEIYDYPGGYAQRFDGVNRSGGDQAEDIQHIFKDRTRTSRIRMEQEEVASLEIKGGGNCGQFMAGHEFGLERHFDANGKYLLTQVEHEANQADYRSELSESFSYENHFICIPTGLAYRPQRVTPRPVIPGIQTATVVGPPGEEIFVDKYGRVKVQFHWDREGKKNADSSCWIRVAQIWAGNHWGAFFWPRIGHEVVVSFEEGDPDQPMVVGSVYNAANMPPLGLPATKMFCGIKSESVRGRAGENYNSVVFVDKKGMEHLAIHSERHMILNAEFDIAARTGRHHSARVSGVQINTTGSLTGGGSGGAPTAGLDPSTPKTSGAIWGQPHPQAILGLNASQVYGSAFTGSVPLSFQLAMGSLSKVIVDPIGFLNAFTEIGLSPTIFGTLASGAFGSAQVVLGTSANIIMGQAYNIILGPPPVDLHTFNKSAFQPVAFALGVAMIIGSAIYLVAYDKHAKTDPSDPAYEQTKYSDDKRSEMLIIYQMLMQVCITTLITIANTTVNVAERNLQNAIDVAFGVEGAIARTAQTAPWGLVLTADLAALVGAAVMPWVLESDGESNLNQSADDTPPAPSSK